ncbi:Gldg family protein [Ruminococcus sp.]|uniref:Gldg family protein n=1 Tax=Ruminococcus sp. TaxID=41978 RepID=UPI0025FFAFA9|nr:Gldg family protein [Ruminococcus sp.]MCR4637657.1 GldG family protein [Ruminococcus sp.]
MSKKELDKNKDLTNSKAPDELVTIEEKTEKEEKPASGFRKKLKYGSMFYIAIALVVAIVVVMNIMVTVIGKRSPIKIDLTPDDRYELSAESVDAVKNIEKDVDITVTAKRDYFDALSSYWRGQTGYEVPFELIPELLDKYSVYAKQGKGSINVKYVDMDVDPDIINKYKKYYNGDIERGSIIVATGERVRVISSTDVMNMIAPDQYLAQTTGEYKFKFSGESTITSAINNVCDAHPVRTAFAATMNGASMFDAQSYGSAAQTFENELLAKNGYDCTDIDIASDELKPEDYDMAVIFAPSVDFSEDVIKKLSDFLYNGGKYDRNVIYVPDVSKTNLPNIEAFLADWNIKVENEIMGDAQNNVGIESNILLKVSDTEAVGKLPNDKLPIVSPYTRALTELSKNNGNIVKSIISSYDEAYTVSITDKNAEVGEEGARTAAMLSQKQTSEDFNVYTSSVLVLGSPYMLESSVILKNTTYNNANVIISALNQLTGKKSGAVILEKSLQYSAISPSTKQAKVIQIIVVWVIPFIIAAIGVMVLLRRRNK